METARPSYFLVKPAIAAIGLAFVLVLPGCNHASAPDIICKPDLSAADIGIIRKLPKPPFFPVDWARTGSRCGQRCFARLAPFSMAWYSEDLVAANEPSLYQVSRTPGTSSTQFRFTWLRSFHPPVTVRIIIEGTDYRLIAKELSGAGGYAPGTVSRTVDRVLTAKERERVDRALRTDLFGPDPDACKVSLDGAQWILESARGPEYRFAERHSPDRGPIRDTGLLMLRLTGWTFEEIY